MKIIEDWRNKTLCCYFCGDTRSVKYTMIIQAKDKGIKEVHCCNKCAMKQSFREF